MNSWKTRLVGCLVLGLLEGLAWADYLEVSRPADVRAEPSKASAVLQRAPAGTDLRLEGEGRQKNGYFPILFGTPEKKGWIYRTTVRRMPGDPPGKMASSLPDDPLRDATLSLTDDDRTIAKKYLWVGKPQAVYERVRQGYVVAEDARLKVPVWVQYELTREDASGGEERGNSFRPDGSIPPGARAELEDYKGSDFDRGHMAPAADMKRSPRAMDESFLLSNMAPQVGKGFNRGIWKDLEDAVRGWAQQRGNLIIVTGPVFDSEGDSVRYRVIGRDRVAVPTHFFKIVVDTHDRDHLAALAFLLPNEDLTGHKFGEYLTSIDEIEAKTGLDFLSALPAEVQRGLESQRAEAVW